jgi:hypothetical protein
MTQRLESRCIGINASGTGSVPQLIAIIGKALVAHHVGTIARSNQLMARGRNISKCSRLARRQVKEIKVEEDIAMRTAMIMTAAAFVLTASPSVAGTITSNSPRLAQADVDVRIGPHPGVVIDEPSRPGVVIEEHRRPGVVIEETEGRARRDCVTRSHSETRDGVTVTQKERECAR